MEKYGSNIRLMPWFGFGHDLTPTYPNLGLSHLTRLDEGTSTVRSLGGLRKRSCLRASRSSRPPVDRKYQVRNELMCRLIYEEKTRVGEKARARTPEVAKQCWHQ